MRRMPRYPEFSDRTSLVSGSVFEKFRSRMAARGSDMMSLHIGDAYLPPPYPLPIDPAFTADRPGFNRYCDTFGIPELRDAL
jgi:aspartate/methionine/tyrosine aminotransferase